MQKTSIHPHRDPGEPTPERAGRSADRHTVCSLRRILLASAVLAVAADPVVASEGGASHYVQGMQGDFAMALIGPAGWYVRNDVVYMDADIGPVTRGYFQLSSYDQQVWVNTTKLIRLFEDGPLCGRMGMVVSLPYALSVDASGTLVSPAGFTLEGEGDGLADPSLTVFANWNPSGNLSYSTGVTAYSDYGDYDPDRLLQYGRNYWSWDVTGSMTWLDPKTGREFSVTGGFMFNEENPATDYETGDEFHLDFMLAQHLSAKLGIGLAGYVYKQVSDDEGSVVGVLPVGQGGFRAEGAGLGPAIKYTLKVGDTDLTIIGKWLRDVHSENRLDYSNATLSFAFRL